MLSVPPVHTKFWTTHVHLEPCLLLLVRGQLNSRGGGGGGGGSESDDHSHDGGRKLHFV